MPIQFQTFNTFNSLLFNQHYENLEEFLRQILNTKNDILQLDIRRGVLWSDSTIFTGRDVLFTFKLLKEFPALDGRGIWSYLDNIILLDDYKLQFTFSSIYVPGLDAIIGQTIVPEHIWSKIEDPINPHPIIDS